MSGNAEGARKAVETKRLKYGDKFFSTSGAKGGVARNKSEKKYTPFSDKDFAREMALKSAAKRKENKAKKLLQTS